MAASRRVSKFFLAFLMISLNSPSSRSMKYIPLSFRALSCFGFSIVHSCFSCFLAAFDLPIQISGHKYSGLVVAWIIIRRSPDHIYPGRVFSFNNVNFVNPVHAADKVRSPPTFQSSLIRFSSRFVCVVLVTSMYFSGIGNDSSFDTKR